MSKRVCKQWTKEEEELIVQTLKDYPTNIMYGFKKASEKLKGRATHSIRQRWYSSIRHNPMYKAITVGSEKGFTQNIKNVHKDKASGELPDQGLKHFQYIMKEMLSLPDKERKLIVNFFNNTTNVNQ